TERAITEVFQDLLGVERVLPDDKFIDLGGHSLQVIEAVARLEARLGVRLSTHDVLVQTIVQLAATCDQTPVVTSLGNSPVFPALPSADVPARTEDVKADSPGYYRLLATSDHWAAKALRSLRKSVLRFSVPVPRIVAPPIRWVYLSLRTMYHLF